MRAWASKTARPKRARKRSLFVCLALAIWGIFHLSKLRSSRNEPFSKMDINSRRDHTFSAGCLDPYTYQEQPGYQKQNATFVMLTRNQELSGVLSSMYSVERHFNQWFQYPYVFLNDQEFSEEFIAQVKAATHAEVKFGVLSALEWEFPANVREQLAFKHSIEDQGDRGIMYGNMESYHKMCRFYSGAFYKHPLVSRHEWYWRIEPDVEFFCDVTYDPFFEMHRRGKKYGFTVLIKELYWTVPNLFRYTRSFIRQNKVKVGDLWGLFVDSYNVAAGDELLNKLANHEWEVERELRDRVEIEHLLETSQFTSAEDVDEELVRTLVRRAKRKPPVIEDKFDNEEYNLCHFWSNFEIARVDLFSTGLYASYFEFLEQSGGFWAERWGDAPVHSLGLGMMLNARDVHYFRDIGYQHSTLAHCPANKRGGQLPYVENPDYATIFGKKRTAYARLGRLGRARSSEETYGTGCRCVCPRKREIEDTSSACFRGWYALTRDDLVARTPVDAPALLHELRNEFYST
ncbi:LAQU0S13e01904g1_1 [Lachancea quebecensis]|uniref:LAQU0S13e01904g1_1 n=1 Tax=Lachancea quebecensis TaxID=1654605 RepID=A0A0P1KW33_9SACH|nr:LAQU0S13e01904g1_1 [Lachancea quebecensis]